LISSICINEKLANDVLLVSKILLENEEALWQKNGDKSYQSNFDKRLLDFGVFFFVI
jgi:hypothetical protein